MKIIDVPPPIMVQLDQPGGGETQAKEFKFIDFVKAHLDAYGSEMKTMSQVAQVGEILAACRAEENSVVRLENADHELLKKASAKIALHVRVEAQLLPFEAAVKNAQDVKVEPK